MRYLLIFSVLSLVYADKAFKDLLNRLFTEESLQVYEISFNITHDLPDVKRKTGRNATITFHAPFVGKTKLHIAGTSVADAAYCLHQLCIEHQVSFSWNDVEKKRFPDELPIAPAQKGHKTCHSPFSIQHALNAVTVSYSMQWFDWKRWERMIDWMALHGINAPLMPLGHESVQRAMLMDYGLDDRDWLPGAAFLSWARMGNLQRWAGPPSLTWTNEQLDLARSVVARMETLDMTPVLPAFSGFLPDSFVDKYPNASYQHLSTWSHFNCTNSCIVWLDPSDELFVKFQGSYLVHQMKMLNYTGSLFALDMFNEVTPKSNNIDFLAKTALDVRSSLPKEATWVMQGWLFHNQPEFWQPAQIKAFLQGVPLGEILVLDLYAENSPFFNVTDSFYGQPFVWCMLGNFGGNTGWYGALPDIVQSFNNSVNMNGTTMVGTGIVPEGLFQNDFVYDFTMQMGFDAIAPNLKHTHYASKWVKARYEMDWATDATPIGSILTNLSHTVWGYQEHGQRPNRDLQKSAILLRPNLDLNINPDAIGINIVDNWKTWIQTVFPAINEPTKSDPYLIVNDNFRYDMVDFTRAALSSIFNFGINDVLSNCAATGKLVTKCGAFDDKCIDRLKQLLDDLNTFLQCSRHFMLGIEERDALKSAPNDDEHLTILNVRNQRTMWGPSAQINDYAARHYHGLVEFYATRWHYFFDTAESGGCSRDSSGYKTFEANILQLEQKFANMTSWPLFNQTQVDDYYPIIHGLWHKYKDLKPAQNENDTV